MDRKNTIVPKNFESLDENENNQHSHNIDLGNKEQTKNKPNCVPLNAFNKKLINILEEDEEEDSFSLLDLIHDIYNNENESLSSLEKIDDKNEKPNLEKSKYNSNFTKEPTKVIAPKETEKKNNFEIMEKKNLIEKNNNHSGINQTKASISDFSEKNQNKKIKSKIDDNKNIMFNQNINNNNKNWKIAYNNKYNTIISGTNFTLFNNQNKIWTNKNDNSFCIIDHEDKKENELENSNNYKILDLSPAKLGFDENLSKKYERSNNKRKLNDKRKKSTKNIKKKKTRKNLNVQTLLNRKMKLSYDELIEEVTDYVINSS